MLVVGFPRKSMLGSSMQSNRHLTVCLFYMYSTLIYVGLAKFENALRWWNNINSYKSEFGSLPAGSSQPAAAEEEDDDDVDLFGSDDEVDEEAEKIKASRLQTIYVV